MGKASHYGHIETDHFQLGRHRRISEWPTSRKACRKDDETDIEMACLLHELVDSAWLYKVGGDDSDLYPVCRREVSSDRLEPIAAPRAQDDVHALGGNLGGHRPTDPVACPRDERPRAISATKPLRAKIVD